MDTLQRDGRATVSVSPREVEQARDIRRSLGDRGPTSPAVTVRSADEGQFSLPQELSALVFELVDLVGRGCTVTIGSLPDEVTTTVAARMLDMSRPSLMKLVRQGQIPAHKVGSHTRLHSKDVLAFRRAQLQRQSEAFDELRALEEEWGVLD